MHLFRKSFIYISALSFATLFACGSAKNINVLSTDDRTQEIELIDDLTYFLTENADSETYAFTKENPVKVGGVKQSEGPLNEKRYLNALLGPNGEEIKYYRSGSCCSFTTPNGMINDMGLLDVYQVYWDGGDDTLTIYINMYDFGNLYVPKGFKSKEP